MASSVFPFQKIGKHGQWQRLTIEEYSDGDKRHWPAKPYRSSSEEGHYLVLGESWAKALNTREPGINYYVDRLPNGYAAFEVDKPGSGGATSYKRLFGHSSGRYYDSAVRFAVHFLWLMNGMAGECDCVLCGKKKVIPIAHRKRAPPPSRDQFGTNFDPPKPMMPRPTRNMAREESGESTRESSASGIATGRARRKLKQSGASYAVDEEGTEDIYKKFLQRLETHKDSVRGIDFDIEEENSLDWRAEHEYNGLGRDHLLASLTQIEQQHAFIPRLGELVLWCRNFLEGHYLMLNNQNLQYMFYSFEQDAWHGFPEWRAGVITAVPNKTTENGPIDFTDILGAPNKTTSLNTAGFRVETLPDPNDPLNKGASKQYSYVPLRNIRPLSLWQTLLRKVPHKCMHPSIKHAFTCMTTLSLVERFKAVGQWNWGKILCKAIYLGAELITVGDMVRLAPLEPSTQCTEVMIVDSVRLNLDDVQPEHVSPTSPFLCSKSIVTFVGRAYTLHISAHEELNDDTRKHASRIPLEQIKTLFRPVGTAEYGNWHALHDSRKRFEVSHEQVLGRMYEADAVRLWTGLLQHKPKVADTLTPKPSLTFDVAGILSARRYATQTDGRVPEPIGSETLWFWADSRAEALALETFNGIEVGKYDGVRTGNTVKHWNAQMQILNGKTITTENTKMINWALHRGLSGQGKKVGRKPGSKVVDGKVVYPGDPNYPNSAQPVGEDNVEVTRPVTFSAMAGAAFVSTDDEGSEALDDDFEIEDFAGQDKGEDMLQQFTRNYAAKKPAPAPELALAKRQMTKADIMESIEGAKEFEDHVSEEEEDWLQEALPPARGGTEESEGGDYDPQHSQKMQMADFGSMGKAPFAHSNEEDDSD